MACSKGAKSWQLRAASQFPHGLLQAVLDHLARPEKPRLHRTLPDLEHAADLFIGKILKVTEHQYLPEVRLQGFDAVLHPVPYILLFQAVKYGRLARRRVNRH